MEDTETEGGDMGIRGRGVDAVFEESDVEVQKKADPLAAQSQIREQLGLAEGTDFFLRVLRASVVSM